MSGAFAAAQSPKGAVLVVHENRGLTDHIRAVTGRLAGDGYTALAPDLLSRAGGTAGAADATAALGAISEADLVADLRSGLAELGRRASGATLGAVGFCFGGGMVWQLLNSGPTELAAAAPFYGPAPDNPAFTGAKAAVLGIFAEQDDRVNAGRDTLDRALPPRASPTSSSPSPARATRSSTTPASATTPPPRPTPTAGCSPGSAPTSAEPAGWP